MFIPEIKEIEKEMIQYLVQSPLFFSRSIVSKTLISYFITRKSLTQEEIYNLTGISRGKISQELNKLIQNGFIEAKPRSSVTKPIIYTMDDVETAFLKDTITILNNSMSWEKKLKQIQSELEDNQQELKKLEGYNKVLKFLNYMLPLMKYSKEKLNELEVLKEDLKKNKLK